MTLHGPTRIPAAVLVILTLATLTACQPEGKPDLGWEKRPLDKDGMIVWAYDARTLLDPLTDSRAADVDRSLGTSAGAVGGGIFGQGGGGIFGQPTSGPDEADVQRQAKVERFVALLKTTVLPDSWAPKGKADVQEKDGLLVVRQTPQGHRQLAYLLADLEEKRPVQITVEVRFIFMPTATLRSLWAEQPAWLTDKQVRQLFEGPLKDSSSFLNALRITLLDGHEAYILVETQTDYLSALPAPPRDPFDIDGVSVWVRATAAKDRERVRLSVRFATEKYRPSSQPDSFSPFVGPQYDNRQEVGTTVEVRNTRTAVLTWVQDQRAMLLLVRPQILPRNEADKH